MKEIKITREQANEITMLLGVLKAISIVPKTKRDCEKLIKIIDKNKYG